MPLIVSVVFQQLPVAFVVVIESPRDKRLPRFRPHKASIVFGHLHPRLICQTLSGNSQRQDLQCERLDVPRHRCFLTSSGAARLLSRWELGDSVQNEALLVDDQLPDDNAEHVLHFTVAWQQLDRQLRPAGDVAVLGVIRAQPLELL